MSCCAVPPDSEAAEEIGSLIARRLAAFLRLLRDHAFTIGAREGSDALRLIASPLASRPTLLQPALRALLTARVSEWRRFDELFQAHWLGRGMKAALRVSGTAAKPRSLREMVTAAEKSAERGGLVDSGPARAASEESSGEPGTSEGASRRESLERTDFRKLADPEAQAEAQALAERLARRMQVRLTRRQKAQRRGRGIDLRRTIRRNIAHGGVPIELLRQRPRVRPLRLVVLLDASGSMELYTSTFLRFLQGILTAFHQAEAFLFHTRLMHVSDALKDRDAGRALERLSLMVQGVGGGTRIGESLEDFNRHHAQRVLHGRSCVLILSDGYDSGPPEQLEAAMQELRRRCRRIVWLNPMMAWRDYEPTARGMQAALPYVDFFAPAHSLESLAALEPYLARI